MVLRGIDLQRVRAPDDKSTSWERRPLASNTFWSRLARYGPFWQEFLFSDPFISEDATDESWIPRRALGKGSYGHVGLWELKRAEDGEVLDRMAIKQRLMSDDLADYDGPWRRHLAYEAVVQSQLCSMPSSEKITRLRKYKCFGAAEATSATVRLYMEYAKDGTLEDLLDRYRAWDMHFSELFLWHTFLGLTRAISLMRQCSRVWQPTAVNSPADDHKDDRSAKDFILHMDFKTANVALGKRKRFEFEIDRHGDDGADESDSSVSDWEDQPDSDEDENDDTPDSEVSSTSTNPGGSHRLSLDGQPEDGLEILDTSDDEGEHPNQFPRYPAIKIIDFGSFRRTGPEDSNNPAQFDDDVGTDFWQSPEQRRWGNSVDPPPHRYQSANFQINEKANVWSVGKIMHDMMTLSRASDVEEKHDDMVVSNGVWQQTYRQLVGPPGGQRTLRHFAESLTTSRRNEYSPALRNLTWRCVRPCRSFRPTSARLVMLVEAGLQKYLANVGGERRLRRGRFRRAQDLHRVLLSVEDFNKIKVRGEANRRVDPHDFDDQEEWLQLIDRPCADFDEPMPTPPKDKWRPFYAEYPLAKHCKQPDVRGQNWGHAGHKIIFNKERKKKRVVSWDAQTQPDPAFRDKLNSMRVGVRGVADNKPMALLEYVLNHEKGDEDAGIEVAKWMYGNNRNPGWRWLQDQTIKDRADVVKKRFPKRTNKECLYFVANAGQGVERVDQSVGDLTTVFG